MRMKEPVKAAVVALIISWTAVGSGQPAGSPTGVRPAPTAWTPQSARELSLESALRELDQQSPGLESSRARAQAASGMVQQVTAALLPTLGASGSYVLNSDEVKLSFEALAALPGAPDPGEVVIQPLDAWTAAAAVRVPLLIPRAWYDVEAARAGQQALEKSAEVTRREARAAYAKLAHGAVALEEVVAASERAVELATAQRDSAGRRTRAGMAAPLDVLRASTEVVRRESDLARARAELERARLALGILLGRNEPVRVTVAPRSEGGLRSRASGGHSTQPEVELLEARAKAERAKIRSARARALPELSATGTAFVSDEPYPTQKHHGWRFAVDLTIPVYDGGLRQGKRREAEASQRAIAADLAQQRLRISQAVADARRDVTVSKEGLRLSITRQQLADDAARSAKRSYDAGVASTLDVLDANDRLYQAEVSVADARARLAQSLIELGRALGVDP